MKLLLVEDDPATAEAISMCFQIYCPELKLDCTKQGMEALSLLMQNGYMGVMLDLSLPDMDGIEVIKQLRAFSKVPVMVTSARNKKEDVAAAIASGANDYIVKPFEWLELMDRSDQVFGIRKKGAN